MPLAAYKELCIDAADPHALSAAGATVLREKGADGIGWTVMAGPEGNEFCAFTPD